MVLEKEIKDLEELMEFAAMKVTSVSKRGIDWHLDHSLRIINSVSDVLKASKPEDYKWTFNIVRSYIFAKGSIPRGKARAPKVVNNKEEIKFEELEAMLKDAKLKISQIEKLPKDANFKHPYFGYIKRDKTIKFLGIHTQHHIKIMQDIKNAAS